jgi:predicted O-linked N-acetylglucosamine transferase (SPINDLY family)
VARGPAPLQLTWLGLPGPTALPHVDHVVADPFIFPDALRAGFTEAPLYLPTLYQCSDSQRPIGRLPTRAELGLPEDAFVYCAFNNNFKFTPEMFECWMRILRQVPRSVLWLLEDNPWSRQNLQAAARAHGVDPARLLFAGRVLPADYLARFSVADLFLDTYPYNAGTTANDALWAGLPLLTLSGRTYVSRMAGSLLSSAGLQALVTHSADGYERTAIEMATEPGRLAALRAHLADEKASGRLFNTSRFAREFELALLQALRGPAAQWPATANAAPAGDT